MLVINEELPARDELLRAYIQIGYGMIGISLDRKGNQRSKKGSDPESQYLRLTLLPGLDNNPNYPLK